MPKRADRRDRDGAREVVRCDVARELQVLDRGVVDRVIDALEERREPALGLHDGRIRVRDASCACSGGARDLAALALRVRRGKLGGLAGLVVVRAGDGRL